MAIFAQLIYEDATPVIEHIGHVPLGQVPTNMEGLPGPAFRTEVSQILRTISERIPRPDPYYRIVIPSEWLHFYVITVESALAAEEKQSFLEWEYSQRLGEFASHLTARFYPFGENEEPGNVLTIMFPRDLLEVFTDAAQFAQVNIQSIEPDVFVSWKSVPKNFASQYLLKFTNHAICVSQYEKQRFMGSGLFRYSRSMGPIRYVRGSVDNTRAKEFQTTLRGVLQGNAPKRSQIWIYGNPLPMQIRTLIQSDKNYRLVSPFSGWNAVLRRADIHDKFAECQYAEVTGIIRT